MKKTFKGSAFDIVLSELVLFKPEQDKVYELEIKEKKKKRSLDANAYCWVLLVQLSKVLRIPPESLYKEFIRKSSNYTVMTLKTQAVAKFSEKWQSNGIGWFIVDLGESKFEGFSHIRAYHGSSSYDTKEMSLLLDEIVYECKENGIETATGSELALLKENWNENK